MKLISGGQNGADIGGLIAAKKFGIPTGGWIPNTFRTEAGPRPDLGKLYNLNEHSSYSYIPRTKSNVIWSDGTLIFGRDSSPGSKLTIKFCKEQAKSYYLFPWTSKSVWPPPNLATSRRKFL